MPISKSENTNHVMDICDLEFLKRRYSCQNRNELTQLCSCGGGIGNFDLSFNTKCLECDAVPSHEKREVITPSRSTDTDAFVTNHDNLPISSSRSPVISTGTPLPILLPTAFLLSCLRRSNHQICFTSLLQ